MAPRHFWFALGKAAIMLAGSISTEAKKEPPVQAVTPDTTIMAVQNEAEVVKPETGLFISP